MRTGRADKFYMGMLLAVMCFCLGLICEMDKAEARRMAEREAAMAVEETVERAPEPVVAVRMLDVTMVAYTEALPVETEPVFVYRMDVPLTAELQETVWNACQEHNVEYELVLGLIEVESTFRTDAVSYVGCYGLMQLNPQYFPSDLSPAENIQYGVAFLAEKLDQYTGDIGAALTAYNAGHDTGNREYAEMVMAAAERWKAE